jgi:acyl-CoA thioester hydrolase
MERRVLWHDIDAQYRMSLSAYGRFVVDCSIEVGAHFGWSVQRSQEQGLVYVARRFWIEIDQLVTLGEDLRISTYVSQLKRSTLVRHYVFHRLPEVEPVAVAHILWVSVDANSGRPIRQPREWLADFESNIV